MDTQSVWGELSTIPIGTIVSWVSVIAVIVSAIWFGIIKLFKVFSKYKEVQDENENQKNLLVQHDECLEEIRLELSKIRGSIHNDKLEEHDEVLAEIRECLEKMNKSLDDQMKINYEYLKHSIVISCQRAIDRNYITTEELQSLEEMFKEYVEIYHGNGYVKGMIIKARKVPILCVTEKTDDVVAK